MNAVADARAEASPRVEEVAAPEDLLLQSLMSYWQDRHPQPGLLPGRDDIDPAALPRLLPHLFLIDVEEGEETPVYRVRLTGGVHDRLYGGSFVGQTVEEAMGEGARFFRCNFDQVRERRAPLCYRGKLIWWEDRDWLDFESIQMPLASDGVKIDMILGAAVFSLLGRKLGY